MTQEHKDDLTGNQKVIYELAMQAINDTRPQRERNIFDLLIEEEIDRISEVVNNATQINK